MIPLEQLSIGRIVNLSDKGMYTIDSGHDIDEIGSHEDSDYCTGVKITRDLLLKMEGVKQEWNASRTSVLLIINERFSVVEWVNNR